MHRSTQDLAPSRRADGVALFLRIAGKDGIDRAVHAGAAGVSYEVGLVDDRAVVDGAPLADCVAAAAERNLCVEVVVGGPLSAGAVKPLFAATVAALVSARLVTDAVVLSSFDHASAMALGGTLPRLSVGLRHLSTLFDPVAYARRAGASSLHPMVGAASSTDLERAAAQGVSVHAWTMTVPGWPIDERTQFEAALEAGFPALTVGDPHLLTLERGAA